MKHFTKSVNLLFYYIAVSGDPQVPHFTASHWGGEL